MQTALPLYDKTKRCARVHKTIYSFLEINDDDGHKIYFYHLQSDLIGNVNEPHSYKYSTYYNIYLSTCT